MPDRLVMFYPYVNEAAIANVVEVLRSRWIGEGPKVKEFEAALQEYLYGHPYCLATSSCTASLRLALAMAGVGPGDEVITPAQTCSATNTPILEQFAVPVFADIQYLTGNLDPDDIEHRITERTKAIIVVHWAGYPADLDEIHEIAEVHGLYVIEDAAHALGAWYRSRMIGTISDFTAFSFGAIKQLTAGEGGLLTVQTQNDYEEGRRRRWYGIDRTLREIRVDGYAHWDQAEVGYKYNMTDIEAAIGLGNLQDLDRNLSHRARMVFHYRKGLYGVPGVTLLANKPDREGSNWLFTMHVENRDDFCRAMKDRGIETSVVHVRNDAHSIFGPLREDLPNTDRWTETTISLPLNDQMEIRDVLRVVDAVQDGW